MYMGKYLRISSYIRKPFLIYDFATAPLWISLYMRKIWFSFYQCVYTSPLSRTEGLSKRGGRGTTFSWAWLVADGYLKGMCPEMNNFFEGQLNQYFLHMRRWFLNCFLLPFYGEIIFKILTQTLFKMIVKAFRTPPVILKSKTVTIFKNYFNFPASSPASGTFYRITCGFLNATSTECKFCCGFW